MTLLEEMDRMRHKTTGKLEQIHTPMKNDAANFLYQNYRSRKGLRTSGP